jgi:hypothetical protein
MIHLEPGTSDGERVREAGRVPASIPAISWRYLGDRAAADSAYCSRFGVAQAPEPWVALGGAWAYTLPDVAPA